MVAEAYAASRTWSAEPRELIVLMYQGILEAVGRARRYLQTDEVEARTREILRAHAILMELTLALDHAAAPELAGTLAGLYEYIQSRLMDAQVSRSEEPLKEVSKLVGTLLEGWLAVVPAAA